MGRREESKNYQTPSKKPKIREYWGSLDSPILNRSESIVSQNK